MDDTWNIFGVIAIHIFPRWILHFVIVWNGYEVTAVVSSNQGNAFLLDLSSCFQSNTFSFVRCYTWIELDTIELHAFCVQVARLYLILIGRIQCWKYFIINGQVRLISSDLFTHCVNTGCRIEVMTCSCRVKIMQINAADKLARARLFIHYFVRTEIWKRKDKCFKSLSKCLRDIMFN